MSIHFTSHEVEKLTIQALEVRLCDHKLGSIFAEPYRLACLDFKRLVYSLFPFLARHTDGTKLALKWHFQGTDAGIDPWYIGLVPIWDWTMNAASGLSGSGVFHACLSGRS